MEEIKRKICISDFTARLGTKIPTYAYGTLVESGSTTYTDWGNVPCDIVVSRMNDGVETIDFSVMPTESKMHYNRLRNIADIFQLIVNGDNKKKEYVLKYPMMANMFGFLKRFMATSSYYYPCKTKDGYKWSEMTETKWWDMFGISYDVDGKENLKLNEEKFFACNWKLMSYMPSASFANECYNAFERVNVCVNPNANELISHFRLNDNVRYEEIFYNFVKEFIDHKYDWSEVTYSQPYISLQISLNADVNNIGTYTPYLQEWMPNKRFYAGEKVHFVLDKDNDPDGNVYELSGDGLTEYDLIEVTKAIHDGMLKRWPDDPHGVTEDDFIEDGSKIYYKKYYYKGYFDNVSKITYFDVIDSNKNIIVDASGNTTHWILSVDSDSEVLHDVISSVTESYLKTLQRKRRAFDENGEELPFVIDDLGSNNTEMNYSLGNVDVRYENGIISCDRLCSIKFYDAQGNSYLPTNNPPKTLDTNIPANCQYIGFEYIDGCRIDEEGNPYENTGVFHSEIYAYEIKTLVKPVSDANCSFVWLKTSYENPTKVNKLPMPTKAEFGTVYQYDGNTSYVLRGEAVSKDVYPETPNYRDVVLLTNGSEGDIAVYDAVMNETGVTFEWKYYVMKDGDAYYLGANINMLYVHGTTREWVDITSRDGASESLIAYNPDTDEYEPIMNGGMYTACPEFAYIDIDYETTYHWSDEIGGFLADNAVLSRMSYLGDYVKKDSFQNVDYFFDEGLAGVSDVKPNINGYIERGKYAAFERHNILGEVNTFQDLLNYKNNLFKL